MGKKTKHTLRSVIQNSARHSRPALFEPYYYISNQKMFAKKKIFFYNKDSVFFTYWHVPRGSI